MSLPVCSICGMPGGRLVECDDVGNEPVIKHVFCNLQEQIGRNITIGSSGSSKIPQQKRSRLHEMWVQAGCGPQSVLPSLRNMQIKDRKL